MKLYDREEQKLPVCDLVDVFCDGPLSGNPLGVVHGGADLTTEQMQAFTNWLGFSETTFLLPPEDQGADYRVRISAEDLAGNVSNPQVVLVRGRSERSKEPLISDLSAPELIILDQINRKS